MKQPYKASGQPYPESHKEDAYLAYNDNDLFPKGTIVEDYFELAPWETGLYDQDAVDTGLAYEYSDEEIEKINLALSQLLGWAWEEYVLTD